MDGTHGRIEAVVPASSRGWHLFVAALVVVVATGFGIVMWVSDFMTLEGEWTIYSATCTGGVWRGNTCTGALEAGERFRFRALRAHREVLFWTVGSMDGESGRYTRCDIRDGRNWTCPVNDHASRTITHQMVRGLPLETADNAHLGFHRIPKWKWQALQLGIPVGRAASN